MSVQFGVQWGGGWGSERRLLRNLLLRINILGGGRTSDIGTHSLGSMIGLGDSILPEPDCSPCWQQVRRQITKHKTSQHFIWWAVNSTENEAQLRTQRNAQWNV